MSEIERYKEDLLTDIIENDIELGHDRDISKLELLSVETLESILNKQISMLG